MSGYIPKSLSDGEEIKEIFHQHWAIYIGPVLISVLTLGILLPITLYMIFSIKFREYGVTNKRIIKKVGIISRNTDEIKNEAVETINIKQGVMARIFGMGDVVITGRGISDIIFKGIDDPMKVKKSLENVA
jgi:uncharacterized membrane protein YdbT with pleckstrin-like domain